MDTDNKPESKTTRKRATAMNETNPRFQEGAKWTVIVLLIANFLISLSSQMEWITADQAAKAKKFSETLIPLMADSQKSVAADSENAIAEKVASEISSGKVNGDLIAKSIKEGVEAIDWKKLLSDQLGPIFLEWLNKLKPKPDPITPLPVDPIKPKPVPPSEFKIVVHDNMNMLIASQTIESGRWFRVSVEGASAEMVWVKTENPLGRSAIGLSGDGREYTGTMSVGDWIAFSVVDRGVLREARIVCNHGPTPPPKPVDPINPINPITPVVPVDPTPDDTKPPVPVSSFRVIFIKESGVTLDAAQTAIPGAKAVRDYLFSKTTRENGVTGWREYDPDTDATNDQPTMRAMWEQVKPKLTAIPCIAIEVNGNVEILPYPKNVAEALALIKKAGV